MTAEHLRYLREQRELTRDELAAKLNCSASAIVHWEGGKRSIPEWVEEKMLKSLPVQFTLEELTELIDYARENKQDLAGLLKDSIRLLLDLKRSNQPLPRSDNVRYMPGTEGLKDRAHGLNEEAQQDYAPPTAAELEQEFKDITGRPRRK